MEEPKATHRVEVYLDSGATLRTEDYFGQDEDPDESIQAEIDSRRSTWKCIGHLTVRFDRIAGFSTEEL